MKLPKNTPWLLAYFLLFVTATVLCLRLVHEPDLWWQLRTGEYILENKTVPDVDVFSYTYEGKPWLVDVAAAVGAGISMGFTEAAHDDGVLSGRGSPWKRGLASGVMTTLGGLGHALPYLIPDFWTATIIAMVVVFIELWAIAWIQNKYMDTPFVRAALQVVLGGALVFAAGAIIGAG